MMPMQPPQGNPNMAAFMQPQQTQPQPQQMPPRPPMGPQQGQPPQPPQPPLPAAQDPKIQALLQQIAKMGRNGDTMLAHLTPGEMMVPKEVQTPKLLKTLMKAYNAAGVKPSQFMAGTPQSSINPATGLPEYNFMSAFLPMALGLAATAATGGLAAPTLMSAAAGGLGSAAGGLMTGQTPTQALLSGALSAGGGYVGGNLASGLPAGGAASEAASAGAVTPAQSAVLAAEHSGEAAATAKGMGIDLASQAPSAAGSMGPQLPNMAQNFVGQNSWMAPYLSTPHLGAAVGSLAGGMAGKMLGAPPKPVGPVYPPGFNTPMNPVGSLGSAQQQLGMTNSQQPAPNFNGYNPATNFPASWNFFPNGA